MGKFYQVVTFIPRKTWQVAKNVNKVIEAPAAIEVKWTAFESWVTKMFGGSTAGCLFGKGAADAAIAYACDDGVCFVE